MEEKSESRPPGYQVSGMTPAPPPQQHRHDLVVVNIPPGQAAPVPWLVVQQTAVSPDYRHKPSVALGSTLIAVGSLSIFLNGISLSVNYYGSAMPGHNFWCGIMYIVAGVFGVLAGKTKSVCLHNVNLVIQIFLLILALVGGIAAIILSSHGCRAGACCCSDYYKQYRLMQNGVPMQMATQSDGKCEPVPYPGPAPPRIIYPTQQPAVSDGEDVPLTGSTGAYDLLARPISNISTSYVAPPDED